VNEELARLWPRVERILDDVLELPEPERSRRAAEACQGDPDLMHAVRGILRADSEPTDFLDRLPDSLFDGAEDEPPTIERIGPFRIVRELGSGGMGTVLLGERDDGTFDQHVAIKVIHRDLAGSDARETLVRERRILARLEHPDIARMYDGGVTPTGEPYFVMELVDGVRIDTACEERGLAAAERVRLFTRVCRAVEFAHGRFVVHCDLKPGNILVTRQGDVKLVDFGIARLLEGEARSSPSVPMRALTPAYAAPEQERGEEVTAATDVFQLGVVLRELLTGERARDTAAGRRLPDELDDIVGRAVRDEAKDRYPTVEAFRRDLEAFLESRPVSARAASAGYLVRKYVARHRVGVAAAATVVVTLLAGLVAVAAQSRVAAAERDRAKSAERRASAVNEFVLQELLRAPMPEASLGRDLTVAEVLGNAARSVEHAFDGDPRTEAEVRLALARTYTALGRAAEASGHANAARRLLANDPATPASSLLAAERAIAEIEFEKGNYRQSRTLLEALHVRQQEQLGPSDPETLRTAASLGRVLCGINEYARAESVLRDAKAVASQSHPELWRLGLAIDAPLARTLYRRDGSVEAERITREMLASLDRHVGPEHPDRVSTLMLLATVLAGQLRYVDAESVAAEAVAASRTIFGGDHPATATALHAQTVALERLGRYPAAIAVEDEALAIATRAGGPEHPKALFYLSGLAILVGNSGDLAAAEPMMRRVVEGRAKVLGETSAETITSLQDWHSLLQEAGRDAEAADVARRTFHAFDVATTPPDADPGLVDKFAEFLLFADPESLQDPARALTLAERAVAATGRQSYVPLRTLGDALERKGRVPDAIAVLREALALPDGIRSWSTEEQVVTLLRQSGSPGDVEAFLLERITTQRAQPRADQRMIAKSLRLLAVHLEGEARLEDAEARFAEAADLYGGILPDDNWELGRIRSELGGCLAARGKPAAAEPLLLDGAKILEADRQAKRWSAQARGRLAKFYDAQGRKDEADRWR
jgi:serine/threonine-protein kinase